jgi:prevent-host-death family protein
MDKIIGLKELRENVAEYAAEVAKGKSFTVVRRSKPIFRITPPIEEVDPVEDAKGYTTLIDFTKVRKGGVPVGEVLAAMDKINRKKWTKSKKR